MKTHTLLISTLVLAFSSLFTSVSFAESHEKMAENAEMECITQAALAEMSDDEKANLEAPLCTGDEGDEVEVEDKEEVKTD